MICNNCGGEMLGNGYTSVIRCENLEENKDVDSAAPDEGPFECEN